MNFTETLRGLMRRIAGARASLALNAQAKNDKRRTIALPSIVGPYGPRAETLAAAEAALQSSC